jgi:hypothetical protein
MNDSTSAQIESLGDIVTGGEGYSFGYEISVRKPAGPITGSLNWNQGWAVLKEPGLNAYFPSWHQPYAIKADLGLNWLGEDGFRKWGNGKFLRTSVQFKLASGMPYTPYLGYLFTHGVDWEYPGYESMALQGSRNSVMRPDYLRLDVKLLDIGREGKWGLGFTILNLTDHENLFYTFYDTDKNPPEAEHVYQFPFFPMLINFEYFF